MIERPLCMREVPGSIPGFSKLSIFVTIVTFFGLFFSFSVLFFPHLSPSKMRVVSHNFLHKITVLQLLSTKTNVLGTRTKVIVVHSLSPAAEDGEDDDLGVSNDSGDMESQKESSELPRANSMPKLDGN